MTADRTRPRLQLLALAIGLSFGQQSFADNYRWTGSTNTDWNTASNWMWGSGSLPTAADQASFDNPAAPTAVLNSSTTIDYLVLGGGSSGSLSILGALTTNQALLGNSTGSSGTLTVSGASASFSVLSRGLNLGNEGTATLTVSGGAAASSTGTVYIGASPGGNGTLNLDTGGSFNASTADLYVGYGGTGAVSVTEGQLESASATLGDGVGSSGTITLTGSGSSWDNTGVLRVGGGGSGQLNIQDGATVTTGSATVASTVASSIDVSGSGSELDITGAFYLGLGANATLNVSSGATVSAGDTVIARHAASTSSATVSGTGSNWTTANLRLGGDSDDPASLGGTATLDVENGASMNTTSVQLGGVANGSGTVTIDDASWTSTGLLSIGYAGNGRFTVQNGATANSANTIIGHLAGGEGTATVTGTGSSWTNGGNLYIGNEGTGTLNVEAGATTSSTGTVYLGAGSTGDGTLNLRTGGSFDAGTNHLFIGYGGTGLVDITAGHLESDGATLGDGTGSSGTATLSGAGSSWSNAGALSVGGSGSGQLSLTGGATLTTQSASVASTVTSSIGVSGTNSLLTINGAFYLGIDGNASLNITNGGKVVSGETIIARHSGSTSTATVTGSNANWTTARLILGGDPFEVGATGGNAALTVSGSASLNTAAALLGGVAGGSGNVTMDDASWTATDRISVGYAGSSTLTIQNGATVSSTGGLAGHLAGSTGTVNITGAGSRWENNGVFYVGNEGGGTLNLTAGGTLTSTDGYVGVATGANGSATISGSGSQWINSGDLLVGHEGGSTGSMLISAGGSVSNLQGILGDLAGASGSLTVTGSGSSWTTTSDLNVGRFGNGTLVLTDGAQASGGRIYIANESGSTGAVLVSGANAQLRSLAKLHVGTGGSGELTVNNGGAISTTELNIATQAGSTGVVNIGAATGASAVAAGTLDTGAIVFGAGSGRLNLNYLGNYTLAATLSGNGSIHQLAGNTTLSGNATAFSGTTTINGGLFAVTGSLGGSLLVGNGGMLSGNGSVGFTTIANGGVIAPGAPGSTLTVNGDFALANGATYVVRANTATADRITVNGNASLAGNLDIRADAAEYDASVRYTILSTSGLVSGSFANVASDFAFVTPVVSYTSNEVNLILTPNGTSYTAVTNTPNQAGVANALTAAAQGGSTSAAFNQVLSRINTLSGSQAQTAFESMSGRAHLGLSSLGMLSSTLQNVGQHNIGGGGAGIGGFGLNSGDALMVADNTASGTMTGVSGEPGLRLRPTRQLWAQAVGGHGNTRSDGNAPGYKSDSGGLLIGADTEVSERLALGLAYQFNNTRLSYDTLGDSATVQGHQLSIYGRYTMDDWRFKAIAGYGWNSYDTRRDIVIGSDITRASADYDGRETGLYLEAAYRIDQGVYAIEPLLSVQHVVLRQDSFREKGAGALGLSADGQTSRSLISMLGGRLQRPLADSGLTGELRAFWRRQWADRGSEVDVAFQGAPGVNFQVSGLEQERDSAVLGIGLSGKASEHLALQLDYNLGVDKRQTQHTLVAGLKYSW